MSEEPDEGKQGRSWTSRIWSEKEGRWVTLHMSTTPPPGTPKRTYLFAKVDSDFDSQGFLDHLHELGELVKRSDNEDADDDDAPAP